MDEPKTLLLRETGIVRLEDGTDAVNVGPIVLALGFLTEGRGDDRGTNEHGTPLPDLLSLAFDVVQSIILGGRAADYFRQVKQDFDAKSGLEGRNSLALAKLAVTVRHRTPSTPLEKVASDLRLRLEKLDELALDADAQAQLTSALQSFRDFGADRWVAASAHLLLALNALGGEEPRESRPRRAKRSGAARPAKAHTKAKPRPRPKPKPKPRARAKAKPVAIRAIMKNASKRR